jgi:hypothetical protein
LEAFGSVPVADCVAPVLANLSLSDTTASSAFRFFDGRMLLLHEKRVVCRVKAFLIDFASPKRSKNYRQIRNESISKNYRQIRNESIIYQAG